MSDGYLTTHVLDTARGCPAAGVRIELYGLNGAPERLADVVTNGDGRTDGPILPGERFRQGAYELVFHAGAYLRETGQPAGFIDTVPVRFEMTEDAHFHVPLLLSPFGYSTYRGS